MGVAGSGKSTVGKLLAEQAAAAFLDADDFHPPTNRAKMAAGQPLDDADREPWLAALAEELRKLDHTEQSFVLACSALKQSYRDQLQAAAPRLMVVWLDVPEETLRTRLQQRSHFFPAELLASQLTTLELPPNALRLDGTLSPEELARQILASQWDC